MSALSSGLLANRVASHALPLGRVRASSRRASTRAAKEMSPLVMPVAEDASSAAPVSLVELLSSCVDAARKGCAEIRAVQLRRRTSGGELASTRKDADDPRSALTEADTAAQLAIVNALRTRWPGLRIVGEEEEDPNPAPGAPLRLDLCDDVVRGPDAASHAGLADWTEPLDALTVFVDPVDGTREFVEGRLDDEPCVPRRRGVPRPSRRGCHRAPVPEDRRRVVRRRRDRRGGRDGGDGGVGPRRARREVGRPRRVRRTIPPRARLAPKPPSARCASRATPRTRASPRRSDARTRRGTRRSAAPGTKSSPSRRGARRWRSCTLGRHSGTRARRKRSSARRAGGAPTSSARRSCTTPSGRAGGSSTTSASWRPDATSPRGDVRGSGRDHDALAAAMRGDDELRAALLTKYAGEANPANRRETNGEAFDVARCRDGAPLEASWVGARVSEALKGGANGSALAAYAAPESSAIRGLMSDACRLELAWRPSDDGECAGMPDTVFCEEGRPGRPGVRAHEGEDAADEDRAGRKSAAVRRRF